MSFSQIVITVVLSLIGAALAVVSNWLAPPKRLRLRVIALIFGLLLIAFVTLSVVLKSVDSRTASPDASHATASPTNTNAPSALPSKRLLQSWVSDVNRTCEPVAQKLTELKQRYENSSNEESVAGLKEVADTYKPLLQALNKIELPSDAAESAKASEWMVAYNDMYGRFVAALLALDEAVQSGKWFAPPELESAKEQLNAARATMKSKGDLLGISCPGMTL